MRYFREGQLEELQEEALKTGLCRNCGDALNSGNITGFLGKNRTGIECEVCTPLKMSPKEPQP